MSSDPTNDRSSDLDLSQGLRVLKERKWIIIGLAILALAASLTRSYLSTPQYRATAKVVMQTTTLDKALFGMQIFQIYDQQRALETASGLVKLTRVAEAVKAQLETTRSAQSLASMVSVTTAAAADLISISAVSPDSTEAANVSNAFARQFILYRQETDRATLRTAREQVQAQYDVMNPEQQASTRGTTLAEKIEELAVLESMQTGGFEMAQEAMPPSSPFSPRTVMDALIALVIGVAVGLVASFILHFADRRVKEEETIERELGAPVIASIPLLGKAWNGKSRSRSTTPIGFLDSGSPMIEAYRTLRSNLRFFEVTRPLRSILVTSSLPREGKTVTTIHLALAYAMSGFRVIILEGDLRRPMIHEYLGLRGELGFSNLLASSHSAAEVVQTVDSSALLPRDAYITGSDSVVKRGQGKGILCITAGPLPPNPAELLASEACTNIIRQLSAMCDYLIVDGPPILLVSDAVELATKVDGVVLVARLGSTTVDEVRNTRAGLEKAATKPLGVVVTGVAKPKSYYRRYGGYYSSS